MKTLATLLLMLVLPYSTTTLASNNDSPYIEINIQGIEEVAPPLNRLADAIEKLSQSDKLSDEDQEKIIAIIGELKTLSGALDNTIQNTREKITQAQNEIADSIRRLIMLSVTGLVLTIIIVCAAILFLFKLQIAPLVTTTSTTVSRALRKLPCARRRSWRGLIRDIWTVFDGGQLLFPRVSQW